MKKLSIIHFLGLALLAMTFNACVEDPIDPGTGGLFTVGPELSLVDEAGFVAFDSTVGSGENFNVRISVTRGDSPLQTFFLQEDGLEVLSARFLVDGVDSGANPKLIVGTDKEGLVWDLTILAHESGTRNYRFIVEDEAGETSSQSLNISTDGGTPPTVEIGGSGMPMVDPGALIGIPVTVGQGTFPLASITVFENDELISDFANRLFYDDASNPFDGNPYVIPTEDQNGFARTIFVRASAESGTTDYRIELADEIGNVTTETFQIITGISGTAVTTLQGILFNAAGPAGTGGLDLDTGVGTGSQDADAEIKDEGIDIGEPNDINWIKSISGVNGTEIRFLLPNANGLPETFDFDDIAVSEEFDGLWETATLLQNTNAAGELMTWPIEEGESFIVRSASRTYVIVIREINETPDNNSDNYVIDVKF